MIRLINIFTIILFLFACKNTTQVSKRVATISPGVAHNLILQQMNNSNFQLIDVRTSAEFSTGHIHGAKNIDWISKKDQLLTLNPNHTIVLYCQSGRRSQLAMNHLSKNGFNYLFNIDGGLYEWKRIVKSLRPSPINEK